MALLFHQTRFLLKHLNQEYSFHRLNVATKSYHSHLNEYTKYQIEYQGKEYEVIGEVQSHEGHDYISYGIAAYADAETCVAKYVIAYVPDVSTNRSAVESLVQRCNILGLSPIHLVDVVEDFLNS